MPLLSESLRRHWAAITALGAILVTTVASARWESGSISVAATSPARGEVVQAAFATGPGGTSYAAWTRRDAGGSPRLEVATGVGAELGGEIEIKTTEAVFDPRIAPARDSALVAFRVGGQTGTRVMVLRLSRAGVVDGPNLVSATPADGHFLEVAAADDGNGVVAWMDSFSRYDASGAPSGLGYRLHAAAVGPEAVPAAEQQVSEDAGTGAASLTVAPEGRAALAWTGTGTEVEAGVRAGGRLSVAEARPGGSFGSPSDLPGAAGDAALGESIAVAYTRDGRLRAAWVEQEGSGYTARYTGVTAIRTAGSFRDRVVLADNPLQYPPSVVALAGGELVAFDRAAPGGYVPEDEAWLDIAAVSGRRVLRRDSLASSGAVNLNRDPVAPTLGAVRSGAMAVWDSENLIAYAPCSVEQGCGEPHDVAGAGRGERLDFSGVGEGAIAWLEGDNPYEFRLFLGRL